MYISYGRINKPQLSQKPGWFYLEADPQIGEYYKWLYSRAFKVWYPSMNGCHITFIAGEKDDRIVSFDELMSYYSKDIEFKYSNQVYTNTQAFWVAVESEELNEIRKSLGLRPRLTMHLTLGNIKNKLKGL
jgi:hypothetical protein